MQNKTQEAPAAQFLPVVMLHSSMSSKAQWNRLTQRLAPDFPVLALDLYGYGATAMPDNPAQFCLMDEVRLVQDAIARALGPHARFHLMGHSYGGAVALRLSLEQPDRVASLALYEPVAFHLLSNQDQGRQEIEAVIANIDLHLQQNPRKATRVFIDYWNEPGTFNGLPEPVQTSFEAQIAKVRLDFQALLNEPVQSVDLKAIQTRTCLVSGNRSPQSTRQIADLLQACLPSMERHCVDGGHMAPIQRADAVNTLWEAFLRR
jgi:pimeloyl-ACP methyl ester carboxylesterase